MPSRLPVTKLTVGVALVIVATIFAGNFLWLRVVVRELPPLAVQAIRFVVAGSVLYAFARVRRPFPRPTRAEWARASLLGLLLVAIGQGCVSYAEQYVGAGLTVLVVCTIPIWVAFLGAIFFGERIAPLTIAGIVTGFIGLVPIVVATGLGAKAAAAIVALLISALTWAVGSLLTRRLRVHEDMLVGIAMQLLTGGIMLALVVAATSARRLASIDVLQVPVEAFAGMAYLTLVGGIVGYTVYIWLLRNAPPAVASTFTYLQAVIGVTLGAVVLHEAVPPGVIGGGITVVAGVACVIASRHDSVASASRENASSSSVRPS